MKNEPSSKEPGLDEFKMSNEQILEAILMRLSGRYTHEERDYLTHELGHDPTTLDLDTADGRIITSSMIKRYMRLWRKDRKKYPAPLDPKKLDDMIAQCDQIIFDAKKHKQKDKKKTSSPSEIQCEAHAVDQSPDQVIIDYTLPSPLPCLTGGLKGKDQKVRAKPLLLDTGSTFCCISLSYLCSMGYDVSDLDASTKYTVKTATGLSKTSGKIQLDVFMRARPSSKHTNSFYSISAPFVVIESDLDKVILGINFLRAAKAQWSLGTGLDFITLNCTSKFGKSVRRNFMISKPSDIYSLMNTSVIRTFEHTPVQVTFTTNTFVDFPSSKYYVENNNINLLPNDSGDLENTQCNFHLESTPLENGRWWPTQSYLAIHTSIVSKDKAEYPAKALTLNIVPINTIEHDLNNNLENITEPLTAPIGPSINEIEAVVQDRLSLSPMISDMPSTDANMPDVSHLNDEYQKKYLDLFKNNSKAVSKNKHDLGVANLKPIYIKHDPNKIASDKVRQFTALELEIIDAHVSDLLKSGVIEESDGKTLWNSNLLLVSTTSEQSKKLSTALADHVSRDERLANLRKAARVCIDLRKVNSVIKNEFATVVLPSLDSLLPRFHNKFISKVDLKSSFFQIPLHEKCRDIFSFRLRHSCYRFKVLPMGYHSSPAHFQQSLSLILNEESFNRFKSRYKLLDGLKFNSTYFFYIDDLAIISPQNHQIHYLLWQFVLEQFETFHIKVNAFKSQILSPMIEYLGIGLNPSTNTYFLTPDRCETFRNYSMPLTRRSLLSRLCTLSYFRSLILGLKLVTTCLMTLVKTKNDYVVQILHKREFLMLQFLLTLRITLNIPNMSESLLCSCDSSHLAFGATLMQWIPNHKDPAKAIDDMLDRTEGLPTTNTSSIACIHTPPCPVFPCQDVINAKQASTPPICHTDPIDKSVPYVPPPISKDHEYELTLCGVMSRSFPSESLLSSIAHKECIALLAAIKHWEMWFRNTLSPIIIFSDCQYLQHLIMLKSSSTRLYQISVYLSSFPNLFIFYNRGRWLSNLTDLLSKSDIDRYIPGDFGISKTILEPKQVLQLPKNTVIDPRTLHNLMLKPLPDTYTDIPHRRKLKYNELPTPSQIEYLINNPTPEESVFKLLFYGPKLLDKRDYIFCKEKQPNQLISKGEFDKIEKKYKLPEIRALLHMIQAHSYHVDHFDDIRQLTKLFVKHVLDFMIVNKLKDKEPTLFDLLKVYNSTTINDKNEFLLLLEAFYESSLNNSKNIKNPTMVDFILIKTSENTSLDFVDPQEKAIYLALNHELHIPSKTTTHLKLGFHIYTCYLPELQVLQQETLLSHVMTFNHGVKTVFKDITLFNPSENTIVLRHMTKLAELKIQPNEPRCSKFDSKICFVLDKLESSDADYQPDPRFLIVGLYNLFASPSAEMEEVEFLTAVDHAFHKKLYESDKIVEVDCKYSETKGDNYNQFVNRLLLLSNLITNNKQLNPDMVEQLQSTDPHVKRIAEMIKNNTTTQFTKINNIIFKRERVYDREYFLLVLDYNTLSYIVESIHNNKHHFSSEVLFAHLSKHFFHPMMKKIIKQVGDNCIGCAFGRSPNKRNYINNPAETDPYILGHTLAIDLIENPNLSSNRFKYIFVCVEETSTALQAFPTKSTKTEEMIEKLLMCFRFFGIPHSVKSDFSPAFSSFAFNDFLQRFSIAHQHTTPLRAQGNGACEVSNKNFRALLTKLILGSTSEQRTKWDSLVSEAVILYNYSIPYPTRQHLSRYAILFSPFKFNPPHLLCAPDVTAEEMHSEQIKSLGLLHKQRQMARKYYRNMQNPFRINQLVTKVLSKSDQKSTEGGTAFLPTSESVFKVIATNPTNCRLRNLKDSSEQTVDIKALMPIKASMLYGCLGYDLDNPGKFLRNVYRRGSNKTMYEDLASLGEDNLMDSMENQTDIRIGEPESPHYNDHIRYKLRNRDIVVHKSEVLTKMVTFKETNEVRYYYSYAPAKEMSHSLNEDLIEEKAECLLSVITQYYGAPDMSKVESDLFQITKLKQAMASTQ